MLAAMATAAPASAPVVPTGAELASLRNLASTHGEALWPGLGGAPFGLLLIEEGQESLLCHPTAPPGFTAAARDEATGCDRLVRPRSELHAGMLAAMPLFGPPSTIVMGTPAAAGISRERWRLAILHEHFHQWQDDLPHFYGRVALLDLAGDDVTGMWMLNFAFPYQDRMVGEAFARASRALAVAVAARGSTAYPARLAHYLVRRRTLAAAAGARNWRYLEFQLWKEGVASWTEIMLGRASDDAALRAEAELRERELIAELDRPDLAQQATAGGLCARRRRGDAARGVRPGLEAGLSHPARHGPADGRGGEAVRARRGRPRPRRTSR